MCEFCICFDFSQVRAVVNGGEAKLINAPENIPFLEEQQFKFCPECGSLLRAKPVASRNVFPSNLRRIRKMRGVSQAALGRALGVQRAAICKYEKGRTQPNAEALNKLAHLLDVTTDELVR